MHVCEGWNESGPQEPHKLAKKIGWENNLSEQGTETMYPRPRNNRDSCQGERAK